MTKVALAFLLFACHSGTTSSTPPPATEPALGHGKGSGSNGTFGEVGPRGQERVHFGEVQVDGPLNKDAVRRSLRRVVTKTSACAEGLPAGTALTVSFTIDGTGHVTAADAVEKDADPKLKDCILGVVKSVEFPAPDGGATVHATIPYQFNMTGPASEPTTGDTDEGQPTELGHGAGDGTGEGFGAGRGIQARGGLVMTLTQTDVATERTLKKNQPKFESCFTTGGNLQADPSFTMAATLDVQIDAGGKVPDARATVTHPPAKNPEKTIPVVLACLEKTAKGLAFAAPAAGKTVTVTAELSFSPPR